MRPLPLAAAALAAVLAASSLHAAHAASATPPSAALAESGDRVVVRFKADAAIVRAHALSASVASHAGTLQARAAALGARHALALQTHGAIAERTQVVRAEGVSARELAARLASDPDVESAQPDRRARRLAVPSDTYFNAGPAVNLTAQTGGPDVGQWYLRTPNATFTASIDAVSAWDTTQGSAATIVAVIDTGITSHPDLAGKVLSGYDMISDARISSDGLGRHADASDPGDYLTQAQINANPQLFAGCAASDSSWHGTQTAGLIGAATNNATGMAAAGWNVRVLPVRVLGKCFGYTSDIAAGIRWAAGVAVPGVPANPNPAKVINLSLGGAGACDPDEAGAISDAIAAGAVVVAAAGNSEGLAVGSPANCPGVIGVAAVRHVGSKVGFSDVGPEVSISAPGGNCINIGVGQPCLYPILTTVNLGTTTPTTAGYTDSFNASVGTSFSAPLAAATAGLMLSVNPSLTPAGVRAAMRSTARPFPQSGLPDDPTTGPLQLCHAPNGVAQDQCYCTTTTCGAGLLDAGAAVRAVTGMNVVIGVSPAAPQAGAAVTFSSAGSTVGPGRTIASYAWSLVDGGGIASGFTGATSGASATLTPTAAGSVTVRVVVTDDMGVAASATQTVAVAAAPVTTPPPSAGGGGGGGALSWPWLAGLTLAVAALATRRKRYV